ncbi:transcription termination factor NusA [Patescibacteria group bacterium]
MNTPRTEFAQALKAIANERGLDPDVILETIKQAIIAAYRRDAKDQGEEIAEDVEIEAKIDPVSGETKVFMKGKDVTPPGFGRIAAQTAKQVIHQKIREAEKGAIMGEFSERVNTLVSGLILRFDGSNVRVDLGRTEAVMVSEERIPSERLNPGQRLTFLLKRIEETLRGKEIILSRADPVFVEKLFAREVPEIASGSVEIKAIAREAGVRTKLAVSSSQPGVDPVGSCVGQKGVRVQAVTNEVGGERVDVIPWSDDTAEMIITALAPAENLTTSLNKKEKIAKVKAPEDQLSLAIGKDGQNVRLAAKLTGWRIEVEALPEEKKTKVKKDSKAEPKKKEEKKEDGTVEKSEDEKK